jgi:glycosyltransferase involved in cell wall biosynthesis
MSSPTISAVVPVYNAEQYISQCLTGILSQTHPPDEIIVVDDGSTDGTPDELRRFRGEVRVVKQANRGHPGAYSRCFEESRGEYVAKCDADDIWEPVKLERQVEAIETHPEIDIAFCGAQSFGRHEEPFGPDPGAGLLGGHDFARRLYRGNLVCSPSTLIRRRLYEQLGSFVDRLPCEDYDYWLRALKAGALFFYDPTVLVRYRRHEGNVTNSDLAMHRAELLVHRWHSDLIDSPALVNKVLAHDLCNVGRSLSRQNRRREARAAFVSSLRHRPTPRGLAWVCVLSAPERYCDALIEVKRGLSSKSSVSSGA